jgi:hypothetical protein
MSTQNGYGSFHAKAVEVANQIKFHGASDDTNTVTLNCSDPMSDYQVDLPSSAGTLLTSGDSIEITQLDVNGATEESSPSNTHEIVVYNGSANRKMTLANLAGLSDFSDMPSGSDGQIVVYDSANSATAVSMSGDATIDNSGAITLADKPSVEKVVEANKLLHADSNRDISNVNDFEASTARGNVVEVGTSTNRWQLRVDASGNLEVAYSSDSGTTYNVRQEFQAS